MKRTTDVNYTIGSGDVATAPTIRAAHPIIADHAATTVLLAARAFALADEQYETALAQHDDPRRLIMFCSAHRTLLRALAVCAVEYGKAVKS